MKALGPGMLLALALLFALPFVEFSCKGRPVVTLNGYEAAFGKKVETHIPVGDWLQEQRGRSRNQEGFSFSIKDDRRSEGNLWILAALVAGVGGGVLAFIWRPAGVLGGIAAVALLLVAQSDIQEKLRVENVSLLTVKFQIGFWLSLAGAGLGAMGCIAGGGAKK